MAPPKGNQFWKERSSHGRKPIFAKPDDLWDAACEYFEWVEANPLLEEKAFNYQGKIFKDTVTKMRAMTVEGLVIFLDIGLQTFYDYRDRDDFSEVVKRIDEIIRTQKFEGASADLLNANIIARDLGLKDARTNEHTGKGGNPMTFLFNPVGSSCKSK